MIEVIPLTLRVRDLEALQAVCRRRGWEFRAGQRHHRWFGIRLDDRPPAPGEGGDELGRCDHAIGIPGCAYEVGLVRRCNSFVPRWDDGPAGGLGRALGPGGGRFWQLYVAEALRRHAQRRGRRVGRSRDSFGTLRLRLAGDDGTALAHVRVGAGGDASLWLFGPAGPELRRLADVLGEPRIDEVTPFEADPAGPSPVAAPS